jgi:soluble lytic murein transglycosylase-like protein
MTTAPITQKMLYMDCVPLYRARRSKRSHGCEINARDGVEFPQAGGRKRRYLPRQAPVIAGIGKVARARWHAVFTADEMQRAMLRSRAVLGRALRFGASLLAALLCLFVMSLTMSGTARANTAETSDIACTQLSGARGWPQWDCINRNNYTADTCASIERNAVRYRLPPDFFARLIWQESRFDPNAVSPAGAQGIAQFMPGTARLRGLSNAFNPSEALERSAEYLRFLADKFGNFGLAAAAYNAGEGRISRFLSGAGYMPLETERYVRIITGYPVTLWASTPPGDVDFRLDEAQPFQVACVRLASTREVPAFDLQVADYKPWGVEVGSHFSPSAAEAIFDRVKSRYSRLIGDETPLILVERNRRFGSALRYHARIGRDTREAALSLCQALSAAGAFCLVVEN